MAAIDRTYVTWEEYREITKFFTKKLLKKQKKEIGFNTHFNKWTKESFVENEVLAIWNTTTLEDIWIAQNCNLECVHDKLKEQYSENWIGFIPDLDFNSKGYIFDITSNESFISPVKELKRNKLKTYSKLLVCGTTFAHKFLHKAENIIRGESYAYNTDEDFNIRFELFGIEFTYNFDKKTNKEIYYIPEIENEIDWGYFPNYYWQKDPFYKIFTEYEIKHTYKLSDIKKYDPEQIIMSHDKDCITLDMYKDFNRSKLKRYISLLPEYIKIK